MLNKIILIGIVLANAKILPTLQEKLNKASPNEQIEALVHLKEKPDFEGKKGLPPRQYVEYLKDFCENSQRDLLNYLKTYHRDKIFDLQTYWIFNGFYIKATKEVIEYLGTRNDVEYLIDNQEVRLSRVTVTQSQEDITENKGIEWNILRVKADSCWMEGYDGTGVIVGHIDTGIDPSHPALQNKWLEPYWYDAIGGRTSPYDDQGHGTHTMGTILGGDGFGPFTEDIGVAPGAKCVVVKAFNSWGSSNLNALHASFQKIAEWKGNGVNIGLCSNSWGNSDAASTEFWQDVLNWRNLNIIPVFAIGNSGPNPNTTSTPGNYPNVIAVGATDNNDNIASFSSRGPAPNQSPWNNTQYWPRSDWNFIKPNISAPGSNIRSARNGGGYVSQQGTSMACPHVAGAVAILLQKNPNLTFEEVYDALLNSARQPSQGGPYPNNNYGWGILDVYGALKLVSGGGQQDTIPNIRYVDCQVIDSNNDNLWDPGETVQIVVRLRNTGGNASNVTVKLSTTSQWVTIDDSTTSFQEIQRNQEVRNVNEPFTVTSSPNTPEGTQVTFNLLIESAGGYQWNYSFSANIGAPGADFENHNSGQLTITVTRYGTIGFMASNQSQGSGCVYPANGLNRLYFGSFAIAVDSPYVSDRYYESNSQDDDDFLTLESPDGRVRKFNNIGGYFELTRAVFSDQSAERPKNLIITQRGYVYPNSPDFVVLEYVIFNNSAAHVSELYAGLFLDWDISTGWFTFDRASTDAQRNLAYVYYLNTYMGSAILNPSRTQNNLISNVSVIKHSTYVNPYSGLPDSIQWKFLRGIYRMSSSDSYGDWSTVLSAGPFDIAPYDSVKVAFAIAGASSASDLSSYIDNAYAKYWEVTVENKESLVKREFTMNTLASNMQLKATLPWRGNTCIRIYNIEGRKVLEKELNSSEGMVQLNLHSLSPGIYYVEFTNGIDTKSSKVIVTR